MASYVYYPRRSDGSASTFLVWELTSDREALALGASVLVDHPSAVEVVVWRGDRVIGRLRARENLRTPDLPSCR